MLYEVITSAELGQVYQAAEKQNLAARAEHNATTKAQATELIGPEGVGADIGLVESLESSSSATFGAINAVLEPIFGVRAMKGIGAAIKNPDNKEIARDIQT